MVIDTEPVAFTTEDGLELSGELSSVADPRALAVICHPHPLYGGNMYNNVVSELFHSLSGAGVRCLRFDFRGVGRSEGDHGGGETERRDVEAAIGAVAAGHPESAETPVLLAGYSFGADVSLTVDHPGLAAWLVVAPPLRLFPAERFSAGADARPKLLVSGTEDDFRPASSAAEFTAEWAATTVVPVEGTDHFFSTGLTEVGAAGRDLVERLAAGGPQVP